LISGVVDCSGTPTEETEVATAGAMGLVAESVTLLTLGALCTIVGVETATFLTTGVVDGSAATGDRAVATVGVVGLVAESVTLPTLGALPTIVDVGSVASLVAAGTTADVVGAEVGGDSDGGLAVVSTGATEEGVASVAVDATDMAPVEPSDGGVVSSAFTGPGTEAVELGTAEVGSVALLLAL
jgi:hypothetical protein